MRRRMVIAGLVSWFAGPPAFAQPAQPGQALRIVRGFYARGFREERMPMSRDLRRLYEAALATSRRLDEPVAGLDFSWRLGAQDADDGWEKTLAFRVLEEAAGTATIEASYRSGDRKVVTYRLLREGGRWRVHDISYAGSKETLSDLLRMGARGGT